MKINRTTAFVCIIIMIISGISLILCKNNILQNIFLGIFTGFIVSFVLSIIGYFHEREKIFNAISFNIKSLYINITDMSKILGNFLITIHNTTEIQDDKLNLLINISKFNISLIDKMNLESYVPVLKNSQKAYVCKRLKEFHDITYSIKYNISENKIKILEYKKQFLIIHQNGKIPSFEEVKYLDNLKNEIIIFTARLHEYITMQSLEVGKIANEFFGDKKWKEIEKKLQIEIENNKKEVE